VSRQQAPRAAVPLTGAERPVDVTPIGWEPPSPHETLPILMALFHVPEGPNDARPAGVFAGIAMGYELSGAGVTVKLAVFAEQTDEDIIARMKRARSLLFGIREQQRLEALHESGQHEKARAAAVKRAESAMAAVGSAFVVEHQKPAPGEGAFDKASPYERPRS